MKRRTFIAGCGVGTVTATAGCLGSVPGIGSDGSSTDTPAGVVEAYIDILEQVYNEPESAQERLAELRHSQAPESRSASQSASSIVDESLTISNVTVNTRLRDISLRQMQSLANADFRDEPLLDTTTIEMLATAETALVDASYDLDFELEIGENTQSSGNTVNVRFLVAVEDEKWRVVLLRPTANQ